MLSEVRWADYTLSGSHPGLHGILAEQPPAADALQPPLRCGFRAQLRRSVRWPAQEVGTAMGKKIGELAAAKSLRPPK